MPTKRQRITALVSEGMTKTEATYQVAKEDLEAQEKLVDEAAVEIVKRDFPDAWETCRATAREAVLKRKRRRKTTTKKVDTEPKVDTKDTDHHDEMAASIIARLPGTARLIIDWGPYSDDPERLSKTWQCSDCQRVTTLGSMVKLADVTDGHIYAEVCTDCIRPVVHRLRSAGISVDTNV